MEMNDATEIFYLKRCKIVILKLPRIENSDRNFITYE